MWRIYYSDGSSFSSEDGGPEDAPALGFVCVVGYDEASRRYILHGWDHYCWDIESRQWWGCDAIGWLDRSIHGKMFAHKVGRTVTRSEFQRLMQLAHEDPDFPQG